jgi:AcrR family transcriptional regulator
MSTQATSSDRPRRSLKERKQELYREVILDAAEGVFANAGYDAAQVTQIAKSAGLSLTTLYRVLPSKWEIYRAVNQRRLSQLTQQAQGIVSVGTSSLDTLLAGIRMQLNFLMNHREYTRIQLKDVASWSTVGAQRTPEQADGLRLGLQLFASLFRQAIRDGFLIDEDPEYMARMVIATQQVRLGLWMERNCELPTDEVLDGVLRQLLRSWARSERLGELLDGVRP